MENAQPAPAPTRYLLRDGRSDDAETVHALVFPARNPKLRWRSLDDVRASLEAGEFYLAFAEYDGIASGASRRAELVGACYNKQPTRDEDPAEFGGAYVHPDHRRRRLGELLGSLALADSYLLHGDAPVMAHVKTGNQDPRGMLARLGFVPQGNEPHGVNPADYAGIEHMETGPDGLVYADMFDFPPAAYRGCIQTALVTASLTTPEGIAIPVAIEVYSYTSNMMARAFASFE